MAEFHRKWLFGSAFDPFLPHQQNYTRAIVDIWTLILFTKQVFSNKVKTNETNAIGNRDMKVTIEEIAKIAGVSKATVSRVLNDVPEGVGPETRARVRQVIEKMNYSTDRSSFMTRTMRSRSIALVLPDITNPFFADIAKAVEARAKQEDYITILANTDFSERNEIKYLASLVAKKIDGIILVPSGVHTRNEHLTPEKYGIPMILLDRNLAGDHDWLGVYSDNEYASFRSCETLINNGSDRIAFLSGPLGVSTSTERLEGYKLALKQYGSGYDPHLVKYGDYTVESGYKAVIELERAGEKYSAILAANDMMTLGALNALKELSYKVPEEVELIGFDNISFSKYFDPPLSTIQQPTVEMGVRAAEMLLSLIGGQTVTESVRLQPKILMRKTTKVRGT